MGEANYIQGIFLDSIFFNEDNGFSIGTILVTEHQCDEEQLKLAYKPVEEKIIDEDVIENGDVRLEKSSRSCYIKGQEMNLTAKEYELLELLVLNAGKVYSREKLLALVWGADYPGDLRTVDVHIRRLREKIEKNPSEPIYVHTKWGVGYYYLCK